MYIVRFVRVDGQPKEEYFYHKENDALYHFSLFEDDDSELYNSVEVVKIHKNKELRLVKLHLDY